MNGRMQVVDPAGNFKKNIMMPETMGGLLIADDKIILFKLTKDRIFDIRIKAEYEENPALYC